MTLPINSIQKLYVSSLSNFQSQVCIAVASEAGIQIEVVLATKDVQASKEFK